MRQIMYVFLILSFYSFTDCWILARLVNLHIDSSQENFLVTKQYMSIFPKFIFQTTTGKRDCRENQHFHLIQNCNKTLKRKHLLANLVDQHF